MEKLMATVSQSKIKQIGHVSCTYVYCMWRNSLFHYDTVQLKIVFDMCFTEPTIQ